MHEITGGRVRRWERAWGKSLGLVKRQNGLTRTSFTLASTG